MGHILHHQGLPFDEEMIVGQQRREAGEEERDSLDES
jgi:hypothetical protein